MRSNKKGMTLVECIIAMAVFAIATTGFTMAATACMKAQVKSGKRMTKTNVQTTNLEHFSTFAHVLDPEYTNVRPMTAGTNQFKMTFPFTASTVENKNVYGYYAKLDSDDPDKVFELSFFSAADQVSLSQGEYWVTLYNNSDSQQWWTVTCESDCTFFDNEKNYTHQTALPSHIWAPSGGYMKFGVANTGGGTGAKLIIKANDSNSANSNEIVIDSSWMPNGTLDNGGTGDNMVSIYFDPSATDTERTDHFINYTDYNKNHPGV